MNEFITDLRRAITATVEGKENLRAAGAGLWASYVRSTMWENAPTNVEAFDARHAAVVAEMEEISPLSKEEKNSITSAKSVVKNAVLRGVDVWKRDGEGSITFDEAGKPIPRGKNDLQDAKSDFERMLAGVDSLIKKFGAETREPFSADELDTLAIRLLGLAESIASEKASVAAMAADEAKF